ncbi:unnamed protein product [Mesocestoides corti]|uniref:Tubulin delta chain n=1 Tax=Mesocestoides corti TaxID=53468 RepID=A0A0R3UG77_MESCO|nr:unnamed protein product [Mesocestoides corti]
MSVVCLHVGQCGNQVGTELFRTIYNDSCDVHVMQKSQTRSDFVFESLETFFYKHDEEARCVQVDMEEKVIRQINVETERNCTWRYPPSSFCAKRGSGNNWALGYLLNGPSCVDAVGDKLMTELEKCDMVDGLIAAMSLAGGTGSGVGTYLLRHLGDLCPKVPVLAQLVWPYRRGEVSIQAYNAVLSAGHLLATGPGEGPDGILFHENDLLHQACARRLIGRDTDSQNVPVPISELNRLMAHQLGGMLQPYSETLHGGRLRRRRLSRLLFDLAGPSDFRLYQIRCLPYHLRNEMKRFATETWPQLFRHGRQLLLTGACVDDSMNWSVSLNSLRGYQRQPLLAYSAVLRGDGASELLSDNQTWLDLTSGLLQDASSRTWRDCPKMPSAGACGRAFNGHPRSLFLATSGGGLVSASGQDDEANAASSDVCAPLRLVRSRAWRLFTSSAYLHQYTQFGLEDPRQTFLDAFAAIEQTIHVYSQLRTS